MSTTQLTERFEAALIYAHRLHAKQTRKLGGEPYIAHLLAVTALVLEDGGSEDEAIAALLHDAVEDQRGLATRQIIQQQFGDEVVAIVDGCTESHSTPKPSWIERKTQYLENLRSASPSVRRVSLADKLHNARSLLSGWQQGGNAIWSKFKQGRAGTLWFYRALVEIYREVGSDAMTQELEQVVANLCHSERD